ncbi:MAG: thymidine phosphorylase [Alphaproteobacteria bacterium]|nr:thymidine phosphorylase [Alphaproteobacteria bacterium]
MLPQEVIRHKRDGKKLTKEEIDFFIKGVADWSVSECQIAAFAMAVYLSGMDNDETTNLTRAMAHSGAVMNWADKGLNGPVLDKHSTGGVGDSVSLILAPLLAACGGFVPMISGRSLGHTGGTLDKLNSIPGYTVVPSLDQFYKVTKEVGCAIIGQTSDLALADKRFYSVRDVTATIESVPLIAASILSKKLSAGIDGLIMDLKCGNGAFMNDLDKAETLAKSMVAAAAGAGLPARAVITNMNEVLGKTVGNALEVTEAVSYLKGEYRNPRLNEIVMTLCSEALLLKGLAQTQKEASEKLQQALDSGKAAELFAKMTAALGGPTDFIENPKKHLPKASVIKPVYAPESGYVAAMDTRKIGSVVIVLGGQRITPDQRIDYAVGFTDFVQIGDKIDDNTPIALIHANSEETFAEAEKMLRSTIQVSDTEPVKEPVIYKTIAA